MSVQEVSSGGHKELFFLSQVAERWRRCKHQRICVHQLYLQAMAASVAKQQLAGSLHSNLNVTVSLKITLDWCGRTASYQSRSGMLPNHHCSLTCSLRNSWLGDCKAHLASQPPAELPAEPVPGQGFCCPIRCRQHGVPGHCLCPGPCLYGSTEVQLAPNRFIIYNEDPDQCAIKSRAISRTILAG